MNSFLDGIDSHLRLMPDSRPRGLADLIRPKCQVLYFPLDLPPHSLTCQYYRSSSSVVEDLQGRRQDEEEAVRNRSQFEGSAGISGDPQPLHIVWPHRWEHDKGPEEFCATLMKLLEAEKNFKVSFLGSHTSDIPECMSDARSRLGERVVHYGPLEREQYWQALKEADIAVSTAKHEFFGVAMMEAVACGCYPLCPNRLVYPEIYPSECLYNTEQQLYKKLAGFCDRPWVLRQMTKAKVELCRFSWGELKPAYTELLDWTNVNS
ncbi:Glycosyltransferase-like domain-containing protein 1 [Geodia barretti]|nr:Glycosyltransferase-like domain-containing protein 1 [Geodia barretti]